MDHHDCPFCDLEKSRILLENEFAAAFLDGFPVAEGHTLVVPKKETDYIFDIDADMHQRFWNFARTVALGIEKTIPCKRIGIAVIGLEVPHAHIHLIPMNHVSDMNFARPKLSFPNEEMEATAFAIRREIKL